MGRTFNTLCVCPHCNKEINLSTQIELKTVIEFKEELEARQAQPVFTEAQLSMLDRAEKHGLLKSFENAVLARQSVDQVPKDMRKFLIMFLKTASPKLVPKFALNRLIKEYPNKQLYFWGAQGICAVIADGAVVQFIPMSIVSGLSIRKVSSSGIRGRIPASEDELEKWIRTKNGYVLEGSLLLEDMRKRSFGEFANIS